MRILPPEAANIRQAVADACGGWRVRLPGSIMAASRRWTRRSGGCFRSSARRACAKTLWWRWHLTTGRSTAGATHGAPAEGCAAPRATSTKGASACRCSCSGPLLRGAGRRRCRRLCICGTCCPRWSRRRASLSTRTRGASSTASLSCRWPPRRSPATSAARGRLADAGHYGGQCTGGAVVCSTRCAKASGSCSRGTATRQAGRTGPLPAAR
mmetsp:Transcript_15716/g.46258  ORF Transcript_15716/g.46258 Transcript_15716/m.46258 type:complete len:212 (+) Transcript_15716:2-637(+)